MNSKTERESEKLRETDISLGGPLKLADFPSSSDRDRH